MAFEAFVSSVNHSIEIGIEEIRVQVAEPLKDGFLNSGIGSEMATCQELLQSEEMKITWCEIRDVGRVFNFLCGGRGRQFSTPVFVKENRVSTPAFVTWHSLCKLPVVGYEFQLGMFPLKAKTLLNFALQSPTIYPSTPPSSNRDFGAPFSLFVFVLLCFF
ncbi:hypothetical protein AVEN_179494-1 [Araneus ventricosus]|uniref:Uncharacterized protein n=1 Tax=Araneus ventricosus TaxID=182803 RepID=A0A4Y2BHI0_ARAVE|nr:hypothetical protein AVEN_179494-1 [Araneus ventricosus]